MRGRKVLGEDIAIVQVSQARTRWGHRGQNTKECGQETCRIGWFWWLNGFGGIMKRESGVQVTPRCSA